MAQFQWSVDVPSGVLRNHALSAKLRYASVAEAKFVQFCKPEPNFGKHKGDTINITRIKNIAVPTSGVLAEGNDVPIDTFSITSTAITVQMYARGVEYHDLAEELGHFDLNNAIQRKLKDQLKLVLDKAAAAAFKTAYVKAIPTSATAITWDTDGTASTAATSNITVGHLGIIRDYMTDTLQVPYWEKENFIGIVATKFLRGIKSDDDFLFWRQYLEPDDVLYRSEVGKVEEIRMVECNYTGSLANNLGTGSVLGEGIIFGEDAVAMAEVLTPELRAAIPDNFGLNKAVAWVGLLEFGLIWAATATAGEARVIHVTSA